MKVSRSGLYVVLSKDNLQSGRKYKTSIFLITCTLMVVILNITILSIFITGPQVDRNNIDPWNLVKPVKV